MTGDTCNLYETGAGRWVVAYNEMWVPGVYDTAVTAVRAAQDFTDADLLTLRGTWEAGGVTTGAELDALAAGDDGEER